MRVSACLALAVLHPAAALNNGLAIKPPMGYNSYMGHTDLMTTAEFFVSSGLRNSGYEYVNSDEGWEEKNRSAAGTIVPKPSFGGPDGIKAFVQKFTDMGLKVGLYGAASGVTCGNLPGQLYHEDIDARTYAEWGISYLKSDNCASYALDSSVRFGAMRDALNRTGAPIILSIEPFSVNPDPEQSSKVSNLWRIACDISSNYPDIVNRADISDKWSPLAGPGGWNDPDMINVKNPPQLSEGENRIYFGLWAIMKSPLLLSSNLGALNPEIIAIVNNTEVIQVNQDDLGIQARKLALDGEALPWLVGLSSCSEAPKRFYSRGLQDTGVQDTREWGVEPHGTTSNQYRLRSLSTNRCLAASVAGENATVVLLPCDEKDGNQVFSFGKGLHSPSSIYSSTTGLALAIGNATLHSHLYGKDPYAVPSAAYGDTSLVFVPRYDQDGCTSRNCQNYDDTQMWYYDPTERLLRAATYVASINHKNDGHGYTLTAKTPTYRHHCLSHVLSTANEGTAQGTTEVWGGPLSGGDYVMAALNRGTTAANVSLRWAMLEMSAVTADTKFDVRDLWLKSDTFSAKAGGFSVHVAPHDIKIFRLKKSSS